MCVDTILPILSAIGLVLGSCGGTPPTPPGPEPSADWTEDEKALMEEHLEDNVLPYYEIEGYVVSWYDEWECISIEAEVGAEAQVEGYIAVLDEAGYTTSYDTEREVDVAQLVLENGHYIDIDVYLTDTGGISIDAYLMIPVEWTPETAIQYFCTALFGTAVLDEDYMVDEQVAGGYWTAANFGTNYTIQGLIEALAGIVPVEFAEDMAPTYIESSDIWGAMYSTDLVSITLITYASDTGDSVGQINTAPVVVE